MTLSREIKDLEKDKFEEVNGTPAIKVSVVSGGSAPSIYSKKLDDTGSVIYVGEATVGSLGSLNVWRIQRITQSGSALEIEWASGNTDFNKVWNDRTTYIYS